MSKFAADDFPTIKRRLDELTAKPQAAEKPEPKSLADIRTAAQAQAQQQATPPRNRSISVSACPEWVSGNHGMCGRSDCMWYTLSAGAAKDSPLCPFHTN